MITRIQELLDLAAVEGFTLAMTPEHILEIEDAGYVVDLRTGDIIGRDDDWFTLTPYGDAMAHLLSAESMVQL